MAATMNDTGQWRMPWDSSAADMFNIFSAGAILPNGPMTIPQNIFWDLPGPPAETGSVPMQKSFSTMSQESDDVSSTRISRALKIY